MCTSRYENISYKSSGKRKSGETHIISLLVLWSHHILYIHHFRESPSTDLAHYHPVKSIRLTEHRRHCLPSHTTIIETKQDNVNHPIYLIVNLHEKNQGMTYHLFARWQSFTVQHISSSRKDNINHIWHILLGNALLLERVPQSVGSENKNVYIIDGEIHNRGDIRSVLSLRPGSSSGRLYSIRSSLGCSSCRHQTSAALLRLCKSFRGLAVQRL